LQTPPGVLAGPKPPLTANINNVMTSEKEQKGYVSNPFLNPIRFWQNYLINCNEASRGFYENAIKANVYWFKAFWDP
jgi:hypothetical protein